MLKPQCPRNRNFTMVTGRKPALVDAPGGCEESIRRDNRKLLCGLQSANNNRFFKYNISIFKLDSLETIRLPNSHFQRGDTLIADVAEKLQTIKIVVWAI